MFKGYKFGVGFTLKKKLLTLLILAFHASHVMAYIDIKGIWKLKMVGGEIWIGIELDRKKWWNPIEKTLHIYYHPLR